MTGRRCDAGSLRNIISSSVRLPSQISTNPSPDHLSVCYIPLSLSLSLFICYIPFPPLHLHVISPFPPLSLSVGYIPLSPSLTLSCLLYPPIPLSLPCLLYPPFPLSLSLLNPLVILSFCLLSLSLSLSVSVCYIPLSFSLFLCRNPLAALNLKIRIVTCTRTSTAAPARTLTVSHSNGLYPHCVPCAKLTAKLTNK